MSHITNFVFVAVAFQEDGMAFVDLGEREVMARFQAVGQMSFIPGIWDPVWSSGQVRVTESVNLLKSAKTKSGSANSF